MKTLFDFITHVKGVEYLIAISFIALYIIYAEILKPKPFRRLVETAKEDLEYIKKTGYKETAKTLLKALSAPFVALAYVVILPFSFFGALAVTAFNGLVTLGSRIAIFGWRPTEAYLAGRKKKEKKEGTK
jgi:Na+/H+ antiporter NhaC